MADSPRKATKKARSGTEARPRRLSAEILTARVYDVAIESALDPAPRLSARLGTGCCSSARTPSPSSASAARGLQQDGPPLAEALARGVICAFGGQPRPGRALAARELGCKAWS
jgi:threonine dehydratase